MATTSETFDFYVDQKVTAWYRTHFEIKADSFEEAKKKALEFYEQGNTCELPWEEYEGTIELMSVEENGGASVTEIYTDMGQMVYHDGNKNYLPQID
jgi:predicted ATPase